MIKNIKQFGKILLIGIVIISNIAFTTNYVKSQSLSKMACERDWLTFISTIISYNDFMEVWRDVFERYPKNVCYYTDIANLQKQMESARTNLRKTISLCGSNIVNLKTAYYELEAELYFLRNFVDISQSEIKQKPAKNLYEELKRNFAFEKEYFSEAKAKELFDKFAAKYKDRVTQTYKKCVDPDMQQLILKWDRLVKTIKEMGSKTEKMAEEWNKAINAPINRTDIANNSFLETRINNLPLKQAPDAVYKELMKASGGTPTIDVYQQSLAKVDETYSKKVDVVSTTAEYDALYKKSSDDIALDFETKLKELNTIIKDSYKPIESLTECIKKTGSRQCK